MKICFEQKSALIEPKLIFMLFGYLTIGFNRPKPEACWRGNRCGLCEDVNLTEACWRGSRCGLCEDVNISLWVLSMSRT